MQFEKESLVQKLSADVDNCGFYVCMLHVFLVGFWQINSQIAPLVQFEKESLASKLSADLSNCGF